MSGSLEAALEAARAQEVPWDAERSARIERGIASRRTRWATTARFARWGLGGLASAALYASVLHVCGVSRERDVSDQGFEEPAALSVAPSGVPPEEAALAERPVGDGGFE